MATKTIDREVFKTQIVSADGIDEYILKKIANSLIEKYICVTHMYSSKAYGNSIFLDNVYIFMSDIEDIEKILNKYGFKIFGIGTTQERKFGIRFVDMESEQ